MAETNYRILLLKGKTKMPQTLADAQISVDHFVQEAKKCAETKICAGEPHTLGFASMLTAFTVILSVSEAVFRDHYNFPLLKKFVSEMQDKTSWLFAAKANPSPSGVDIAQTLTEVRNGLAHELSLPNNVMLANSSTTARELSKTNTDKYIISTIDFVSAVEVTVNKLIAANPKSDFDPFKKASQAREPASAWLVDAGQKPDSVSSPDTPSASATKKP
jgi:hypothetical protein